MKIHFNLITKLTFAIVLALVTFSCQDMDRPELGDYPEDANPVGGPLKFYVNFDLETTDPLKFAVDQIRANFPTDNPLTKSTGITGNAVTGGIPKKFIQYSKPNDWANTVSTGFTIAFWMKHAAPTQTEFAFAMQNADHWAKANLFALFEGSVSSPVIKLHIDDSKPGDKWFEWTGSKAITGIFDNQWHHLAFVYSSTTSDIIAYRDGTAFASNSNWGTQGTISFDTSKVGGFRIGGSGNPEEGWMNSWTGSIDNFRLYNTSLSATEVQSLVTAKQ